MNKDKLINKFKLSQDYIDICYMIDHVNDIDARVSCLECLGYRVGVDVVKIDFGVKNVYIGKKNDIRIQITPKNKNINLAKCVIIEEYG